LETALELFACELLVLAELDELLSFELFPALDELLAVPDD